MRHHTLLLLSALASLMSTNAIGTPAHEKDPVIVTTAWLAAHLKDPDLVILQIDMGMDMGGPTYASGHIPGARALSVAAITVDKAPLQEEMPPAEQLRAAFEAVGVSDASHVILYYSDEAPSAARALVALDYLGHSRVSFLDGGLPKWRKENRALSTVTPTVARGSMHVKENANVIVTADWIQSRIGKPGLALIDTRTDGEYLGTGARRGWVSNGHLAGAHQLQWEQLFVGDSGSASGAPLKDRAVLAKLYGDRMHTGDTVVTYCWVGYRASTTYLAARALGLPVKLYDGSYQDWSQRKLPLTAGATP